MPDVKSVLLRGFRNMHGLLDRAADHMSLEQLNWRPERGLSAFFSLWHCARTEDNIVNFVVRGKNTVWLEQGYCERLGLPRTSQGTGMTADEAAAIVLRDVEEWRAYQRAVWEETERFVEALTLASSIPARSPLSH